MYPLEEYDTVFLSNFTAYGIKVQWPIQLAYPIICEEYGTISSFITGQDLIIGKFSILVVR